MKKWDVAIPFTGVIHVEVEAETEKEAIEKAFESDQLSLDNESIEWESHTRIVEGNVFHGVQNEVDAEEM